MDLNTRIKAFVELGQFMAQFSSKESVVAENRLNEKFYTDFEELIKDVKVHNPWFTEDNVRNAIASISEMLKEENLVEWVSSYISEINKREKINTVAVIMAGNIPLVGFHDMLCVLISGNKFLGKLSSDDKLLMPFIANILIDIEAEFVNLIEFTDSQIKTMDAVIATGSNNSARYFEYYFGKYPHIIRKNRNSVAILLGSETEEDLMKLGRDIFQYFGLGCRNVAKLFVPANYNFDIFYESIYEFQDIVSHNKYANNYEYNRTVYLMKNDPSLLDNNFLLLKQDETYSSPIGVLYYEFYETIAELNKKLESEKEQIQCVVSNSVDIIDAVPFGKAQCPALSDYADGVDTMKFLAGLK